MKTLALILALTATAIVPTAGFAQTGPVAKVCAADIAKYCGGKGHTAGQTRSCLEANRKKVTAECRATLDSTGGRGR
jgi:hypothetical protein